MSPLQFDKILNHLKKGEIRLEGKFVHGSNHTFLAKIHPEDGESFLAVYKPVEGERILWDFPDNTLAHREVAAFLVSEVLGWGLIPPTIFRDNGPYGAGSVQLFIEHDPNLNYFNFNDDVFQTLRPVVLLDLLINNADRKGGHLILGTNNQIWLIDHGVSFNVAQKLRTVMWDFAGEPVSKDLHTSLEEFLSKLEAPSEFLSQIKKHLSPKEIIALLNRTKELLTLKEFPAPPKGRRAYPFPPI